MRIDQKQLFLFVAKAKDFNNEWVYGYPVKLGEVFIYEKTTGEKIKVRPDTVCYSTLENDKHGRELFIGDTINDFGGGLYVTDKKSTEYHPTQAFPPLKCIGDKTRLGHIVFEEGTTRIQTIEMDYCYNISNGSRLCEMEYHSNIWDNIYPSNK